jgi:hypothetical protein
MANSPNPQGSESIEGEPATASEMVTISRAELDALLARLDATAVRAFHDPEVSTAPDGSPVLERALAEEVAARDQQIAEMERVCKAAVKDREIATALAGRPLVPGAASQLVKLWRDDFDVYEEDGAFKVTARDGRTVAQAVGERLASPEYSHFCLPASRGGTGAREASRPASGAAAPGVPKNLGEAIVVRWREDSATRPNNFLKPIGLRRHR